MRQNVQIGFNQKENCHYADIVDLDLPKHFFKYHTYYNIINYWNLK